MVYRHKRVSSGNYRRLAWVEFQPTTTEFRSEALTDWATLKADFVQLIQHHIFVLCARFILTIIFVSHDICFKWNLAKVIVIMLAAEWIDTYGIHHWRIFNSSYRKLAWVRFEPTTNRIPLNALTDWAIRPWVQPALRPNFVKLLQFHLFNECSPFISAIAFVSRHISFKWDLAQVIILAMG